MAINYHLIHDIIDIQINHSYPLIKLIINNHWYPDSSSKYQ